MKQQTNNPVPNFFLASAADFKKIPGSPIAYWVSDSVHKAFEKELPLSKKYPVKSGIMTGNDALFLRLWHEVPIQNISFGLTSADQMKGYWYPISKGGDFRKWFGNNEHVINLRDDGNDIRNGGGNYRLREDKLYFKPYVTWSRISSASIAFRVLDGGTLFADAAPGIFAENECKDIISVLNSKLGNYFLAALNPTLNYQTNDIERLPSVSLDSSHSTTLAIEFAKEDWDSYEISWDFSCLPLLHPDRHQPTLKATYEKVRALWHAMTLEMQRLEEENNRIFIDAYGLQDELTPEVPLSEITLTCNPHYRYGGNKTEEELETQLLTDTMEELISYAIGCMMGRYRLDVPGLIYAHSGNTDFEKIYHRKDAEDAKKEENSASRICEADPSPLRSLRLCGEFPPDDDGIIPIMDIPWFPDDAAHRFVEFMKVAWTAETLDENLKFVADSLNLKRGEDPIDTIRRYLSTGFFKDHLKTYKKRPIYWLFSSGKQKAFECLVYLHRYNESTLSRMRSSYVTPLQGNIRSRIEFLDNEQKAATSASDQRKFQKEMDMLKKKQAELSKFDDELRHYADMRISLDLDDGVKVNYGKFGNLLAEVKAITGE